MTYLLAELTSDALGKLVASGMNCVLLPVGSVEPHGPHLPLGTDSYISEGACKAAVPLLRERGVVALVAPTLPYGVTDFAKGFPGALSVEAPALTAILVSIVRALRGQGFTHVCIVNNHLEPAQDEAVRGVLSSFGEGEVSVACPLQRRHARTLSDEFKRGECHAGEYETSLVLAMRPELVAREVTADLPEVPVSLSDGIRAGKTTFAAMGMDRAYAGAPARATAAEGETMLALLASMVVTEVIGALGSARPLPR